jgi:hypothetical protein
MPKYTYTQLVNTLRNVTIDGVNRKYDSPPKKINNADLPVQFPTLPTSDEGPITFSGVGLELPVMRCGLYVVFEAASQNLNEINFDKTIEMMDNVAAAMRSSQMGRGRKWSLQTVLLAWGNVNYWAVLVEVEATA